MLQKDKGKLNPKYTHMHMFLIITNYILYLCGTCLIQL